MLNIFQFLKPYIIDSSKGDEINKRLKDQVFWLDMLRLEYENSAIF